MTLEEAKLAIDGFKAKGITDEEIVATLYLMFQDDKLNVEELESLVGLVGYELTEEFLNMSKEEQKDGETVLGLKPTYYSLKNLSDILYDMCAHDIITEGQLINMLKIIDFTYIENYLLRFKILKKRKQGDK